MQATRQTMETRLSNGLVIGHAYSITRVLEVRFIVMSLHCIQPTTTEEG